MLIERARRCPPDGSRLIVQYPRLPTSKVRERLSDILNEVSIRGDRVVLERHGKDVAAVISMQDLELLEMLEDRLDIELSREALAESGERIAWEQVKAKLGL